MEDSRRQGSTGNRLQEILHRVCVVLYSVRLRRHRFHLPSRWIRDRLPAGLIQGLYAAIVFINPKISRTHNFGRGNLICYRVEQSNDHDRKPEWWVLNWKKSGSGKGTTLRCRNRVFNPLQIQNTNTLTSDHGVAGLRFRLSISQTHRSCLHSATKCSTLLWKNGYAPLPSELKEFLQANGRND